MKVGRYKHYKGNEYEAFCVAHDYFDNEFVLYKQCYGNEQFWIRPYNMFFDYVSVGSESVPRFTLLETQEVSQEQKIQELIDLIIHNGVTCIKHTETEKDYLVTNIDEASRFVSVYPTEVTCMAGYLSRFELLKRMGYYACYINNEMKYFNYPVVINDQKSLRIGNNRIEMMNKVQPCSIDLEIADSGYLSTKRQTVDPQSIEHVTRASELWQEVKVYPSMVSSSSYSSYFKLPPGKTVLTHTKERIKIPNDCAGKIEIKSTYARLSLSITSGDYCNPGYDGYFPLEITNHGMHTIIIHNNLAMAQLMLVPLQGPILKKYDSQTFINKEGYDDGTPYTFWRETSIKAMREASGSEIVVDYYKTIRMAINEKNTLDVNEYRERFDNTFLPYCQRKINESKRKNRNNNHIDANQLLREYINHEKMIKSVFKIKWASIVLAFICAVIPVLLPLIIGKFIDNGQSGFSFRVMFSYWPWFMGAIALLILFVILYIKSPKTFCTFESIDLEATLAGNN